jgi:elongation factor 1-gamma
MNERALNDCKSSLTELNNALESKTTLVGSNVTVADIAVASSLVYVFRFCLDGAFRAAFPHVQRWFNFVVSQPQWVSVWGKSFLCETPLKVAQ